MRQARRRRSSRSGDRRAGDDDPRAVSSAATGGYRPKTSAPPPVRATPFSFTRSFVVSEKISSTLTLAVQGAASSAC